MTRAVASSAPVQAWNLSVIESGWENVLFFRLNRLLEGAASLVRRPNFFSVVLRDKHYAIAGRATVDLVQMLSQILAPSREKPRPVRPSHTMSTMRLVAPQGRPLVL
jgi:hypothetical protein